MIHRFRLFWYILLSATFGYLPGNAQNVSAFYIGHSLSDQIAEMVNSMCAQSGQNTFTFAYQSIPGSPLRWSWGVKERNDFNAIPSYFYPFHDENHGLASGKHNVLVLTESVPRQRQFDWGIKETKLYADSFYQYATSFKPDIKVFLYEVWHCIHSGTPTGCMYDVDSNPWRQRLDDDISMWEEVVDHLNQKYQPEKPVCMIPGGSGLARLYDEIEDGNFPGYQHISDLFTDDIHLTDVGKYFIACIHYATLFEKNPVGLPAQLFSIWGVPFEAPTEEIAAKLQEIAWETVTNYQHNCLTNTATIDNDFLEKNKLTIYPNPANTEISWYDDTQIRESQGAIYDLFGKHIMNVENDHANVRTLAPGIYILKVGRSVGRFVKW